MRKSNQQTIGQLLELFIKQNKLENRLEEVEIESSWKEIVGTYMAKHTTEIKIYKETLFIKMNSAACREELMYRKSALIEEVNKFAGKKIVSEIIIR
jgi:predicted nucleic acid-binding Zn ribbon protein